VKTFFPLAALLIWVTGCAQVSTPRADFLQIVQRPRVPLAPQVGKISETNGLLQFRFSFCSDSKDRVPGILIEPANLSGRHPVVITLHGTGGDKEGMIPLCRKLAQCGFIAVAMDARYHGERKTKKTDYEDAIVRAYHGSGDHPFYYDTVYDVMRLVDYLQKGMNSKLKAL
jgi:cephalosporin-C deacetylase-like acetyl esterase